MPRLIKDGVIIEDDAADQAAGLEQWLALQDKRDSAVRLEPGDDPAALYDHLDDIALVAVHFPVFTDGRGFSYGRDLRERGFSGELRACGAFMRDQLSYLARLGFNAFQFDDESRLEGALHSLRDLSESYQAAIDQPQPLFRRRGQA